MCADPFFFEESNGVKTVKNPDFLQECPNDGKNYTMCRKIYQYVRDEERVIRSCGYEEDKDPERECYMTVLEEYNTYVCRCREDGCNAATPISISIASVMAAISLKMIL